MAIHHFCTEDAAQYGIEEAIVLQNIGFWCATNLAKRQNIHDGRVWTYNPARAWLEITPYICPAKNIQPEDFENEADYQQAKDRDQKRRIEKFRTIFKSLEKQGAIVSGNYNKNKADQIKWYSLADQNNLSKYQEVSPEALELLNPEISGMHETSIQKFLDCNQKSLDSSYRYKKQINSSSKRENATTEPEFNFDLILAWIINKLMQVHGLTSTDEIFIEGALHDYHDSATRPRRAPAFDWCEQALLNRMATLRRSAKNSAARDKVSGSVVNQLEAQAAVINSHTDNMKPRDRMDTSWADGLEEA